MRSPLQPKSNLYLQLYRENELAKKIYFLCLFKLRYFTTDDNIYNASASASDLIEIDRTQNKQ